MHGPGDLISGLSWNLVSTSMKGCSSQWMNWRGGKWLLLIAALIFFLGPFLNHSDVHFITSGGGSKAWQGMQAPTEEDGLQFGYDGQGFVSVSMTVASLHLQFHDALGSTLYSLDLNKH